MNNATTSRPSKNFLSGARARHQFRSEQVPRPYRPLGTTSAALIDALRSALDGGVNPEELRALIGSGLHPNAPCRARASEREPTYAADQAIGGGI
jgi:hypothetical protein